GKCDEGASMLSTILTAVSVFWGSGSHLSESAWDTDYAEALKHVRSLDKPLFIVFDAGASETGHAVQTGVYMNDKVERALADDFIRLFVNIESEPGLILAADFGVTEYPRI